jgi:hypothetical protein
MSQPTDLELERIKGISSLDLPDELQIGGATWLQVDRIRMRDEESEQKHDVMFQATLDLYARRDAFKYPDGVKLQDLGRAQCGGFVTFRVRRLRPGRPLLILRRMDYVFECVLEYEVDGAPAGTCPQVGTDRVHRFRNWPFLVPGELITGTEATIKQIAAQGKDISMYRFWFYQPMVKDSDV